jgi:tetratricopeptide (TPR) repeat protein
MSSSTAQDYFELIGDEPRAKLALLACSAALRLDDETAHVAIELVAQSNGSSESLLQRVKNLGCVWKDWDGSWYVTEDVRPHLLDRLEKEVSETTLIGLRERLASSADLRAQRMPADGQVTSYDKLLSNFEAAYQRLLIPEQSDHGAAQLVELWQHSPVAAATATARSVDYLADELNRRLRRLPDEVLFLRGMAARSRGDRKNEERYFREVWKRGRKGYIYAVAAHLFALLIKNRDREVAEQAMRDSIEWNDSGYNRALVYNSLGSLLAKDFRRHEEAERAYRQSLKLRDEPQHQAQVYHSLGNLFAKDRDRWQEAEQAFRHSLKVDSDSESRAQTFHSLANLLTKDRRRWKEAEDTYRESLRLSRDNYSRAEALHSLGNFLAKDWRRSQDAALAYRQSIELRSESQHQKQVYHSLGNLFMKDRNHWPEAEEAFRQSLGRSRDDYSRAQILHSFGKLLMKMPDRRPEGESVLTESFELQDDTPDGQAQVLGTWAVALSELDDEQSDCRAEEYALRGIELARRNLQTRGVLYRVLARIYERRNDYTKAIEACRKWKDADVKLGNRKFANDAQAKIDELSQKIKE